MEVIKDTVNLSFVPISSPLFFLVLLLVLLLLIIIILTIVVVVVDIVIIIRILFDKAGYRTGLPSVLRLTTPWCSMSPTLYEQVPLRPTRIETESKGF